MSNNESSNKEKHGLISRYAISVVLLAMLFLVLVMRGWVFCIFMVIFASLAYQEVYVALRGADLHPIHWVGLSFIVLMYPAYLWKGFIGIVSLDLLLSIYILSGFLFHKHLRYIDLIATLFILTYPCWPFACFGLLNTLEPYQLSQITIFIAVISPVLTDVGGYFIGHAFGKHKLCAISPKKTIEGAVGGFVLNVLVMSVIGYFTIRYYYPELALYHFILMSCIAGLFAQLGDLIASALKRFAGIKDFSNRLLGHGGVLDRFDSIIFGAVSTCLYVMLFLQ